VSRATLHNLGRAFAWYLYPRIERDERSATTSVIVARGGDVIPHIVARQDGRMRQTLSASSTNYDTSVGDVRSTSQLDYNAA
jgi:hypothetical protein